MKLKLMLILVLLPVICSAQNLVKCSDSTAFFVTQTNDFYCYIKLKGKIVPSGNDRVVAIDSCALQTLLIKKNNYLAAGEENLIVITNYIIGEKLYFTKYFGEEVKITKFPIKLENNMEVMFWYYDIPEKLRNQAKPPVVPILKQVSITAIVDNYIYTINSTQSALQSLDDIQKFLTKIANTLIYGNGQISLDKICDQIKN